MSADDRFFDTNVLLYLLSGDGAKADVAEALLASGGVVSIQVLDEFASVAMRKLKLELSDVCEILSTVRKLCLVKPNDISTHELGLDLVEKHRLSLYDAMIVASALNARCTLLYSEDFQHDKVFDGITISNPFLADMA